MRRNLLLGGVVVAVIAAAGIGWFFGSQIRSPAEVAAEAEPPEPSNITVEVVSEVLSADIITRGDIVYDEPASVGLSGSFADTPEALVVTQSVEVNSELAEGDMAVEVVGRPVFLLTGEIPMYRDLRPGASGDDVFQVEEALVRMGFFDGTPDATWDQETGAAVAAWYEEAGYRPNGLSEEDETALRAARDRVQGAEGAVADSQSALADAQSGTGESAIASARAEIDAAKDALELAEIDAARAEELAAEAVNAAQTALDVATDERVEAEELLAQAQAAQPPPTQEELAALESAMKEATGAVAAAETALDQASFDVGRTATEQAALVAAAAGRLDVAEASLADLQKGVDTSAIRRQIGSAQEELELARQELAELETALGTWLPAGEVVFLKRMPVRVDQVATARGSLIDGSFITVSGSELALRSSVGERDAPRVEEGMEVQIENPESGDVIAGVISLKAESTGTNGVATDRVFLEIDPAELPEEIIGTNVKVVIPVSSTGGEVLAVPAAALSATADGSTILQAENPDGTLRSVKVEAGLAAGGLVEVTPVDGVLAEGDLVVVGREGRSDGSIDTAEPSDDAADA